MKKLVLIFIVSITIVLTSCTEEQTVPQFSAEFSRIIELIPEEFEEDIILPDASGTFTVEYQINNIDVRNNTILFEQLSENKEIELEIKLKYGDEKDKRRIIITQIGDEVKFAEYEINKFFETNFDRIDHEVPDIATSNFTLPKVDNVFSYVTYSVDCTEINRERVVYTFPVSDSTCNLTVDLIYKGQVRSKVIEFIMSSVNNLPRIPTIHIDTLYGETIDIDQEFVEATLTLNPNGHSIGTELVDVPVWIRLRGNSTLYMPKPSFKIKFEEKQKLLSRYREKDWVLLGNYVDQTLLRNYLAFSMSSRMNMAFTPSYTFVDVYVDGEYKGNYLLTDQIEVTNDRVDIEENLPTIDTGYLVEYDIGLLRIGLENTDENYFLIDGIPFVIKSPEHTDEHYMSSQKTFISNYFESVFTTLKNGNDYSQLIDDSTFIDWFIVNEIFQNVDAGYSSVYYYKDAGGLLKMGPIWDFDLSSGNAGYLYPRDPEGWYVANDNKNILLHYLMDYPEFREKLKDRWNQLYENALYPVVNQVHYVADSITYSRYQNFITWDIIGKDNNWYTAPELLALTEYDDHVWHLYDFLKVRLEWLNVEINNLN